VKSTQDTNVTAPSPRGRVGKGSLESQYYKDKVEAGCDEAGRGCLAGPVFAAAVILPPNYQNDLLNDSKQLTEKKRYLLREQIERDAVAWAVGIVSNEEIDQINILRASILAMHRALDQLNPVPEAVIVDGNRFCEWTPKDRPTVAKDIRGSLSVRAGGRTIPYTTIVKGDGKYLAIAAASILAKTYRDDFMMKIHGEYDQYAWNKNKGYPSKAHREAIKQFGATPYHRISFKLLEGELTDFKDNSVDPENSQQLLIQF